jgi:threonine aldolase
MFAMWPYAAAGLVGLRRRAPLMPRYVEYARAVCAELATIDGVTVVPDPPVTNMAHLYLRTSRDGFAAATRALAMEEKVWTWSHLGTADMPDRVVVELTVGDASLEWTPEEARDLVAGLLERAGADRT